MSKNEDAPYFPEAKPVILKISSVKLDLLEHDPETYGGYRLYGSIPAGYISEVKL